jgi:hypothetical protein
MSQLSPEPTPTMLYNTEPLKKSNYFLHFMPKWRKQDVIAQKPKLTLTTPISDTLNSPLIIMEPKKPKKYTISQLAKSKPPVPVATVKILDPIMNISVLPDVNLNIIPKNIFLTWKSYDIPYDMSATINKNKADYPDFTFYIYDDKLCKDFITAHFNSTVVDAFNTLIPGSYKADLWRYCVLYIHGGIYMDIKFKILGLDLLKLIENECFVKDRPSHFKNGKGVYNGFIVVKPRNNYLLQAIQTIILNVQIKNYGHNPLYPTGPGLLGEILPPDYNFKLTYDCKDLQNIVYLNNKPILESYTTYRSEQKFATVKTYGELWHKRAVYA